jgi:hypothetical protein
MDLDIGRDPIQVRKSGSEAQENSPDILGQVPEVRRSEGSEVRGTGWLQYLEGWISSQMMDGGSRADPTEV